MSVFIAWFQDWPHQAGICKYSSFFIKRKNNLCTNTLTSHKLLIIVSSPFWILFQKQLERSGHASCALLSRDPPKPSGTCTLLLYPGLQLVKWLLRPLSLDLHNYLVSI